MAAIEGRTGRDVRRAVLAHLVRSAVPKRSQEKRERRILRLVRRLGNVADGTDVVPTANSVRTELNLQMELPTLQSLIGGRVSEIELIEPISWWFRFSDGAAIRADTLWRLVNGQRVQTTSYDHRHQFGLPEPVDAANEALKIVRSAVVTKVRVAQPTGDLCLEFENGARLEILTTSSGYESWAVFLPNGNEIMGLGGGDVQVIE